MRGDHQNLKRAPMANPTYEVRVAGVVPAQDLLELGATTATTEYASTLIFGEIFDEAKLFELLSRLRALGLEVVEVRRTPAITPLAEQDETP